MIDTGKERLRRTMMSLNAWKPGLIEDPCIYRLNSIMLNLEGAAVENQRDAVKFSLYHALRTINCRGYKGMVCINGLDTSYRKEDIRCVVAGGCDATHIPKTERPEDMRTVEGHIGTAEKEFDIPEGRTLIMAAIESTRGVAKTFDIYEASKRLFGIVLSGGDYTRGLQTHITGTGIRLMGAHRSMIAAARTTGVRCFDTVYTNPGDMEGFHRDVETVHPIGFDEESIINPRQITIARGIFTPTPKDIIFTEKMVREIGNKKAREIGVLTVSSKMIDIVFYDGARRIVALAKASGMYKGDL